MSAITGATANSVLFASPAGLLTTTPSLMGYNSSTQTFTLGTNQITGQTASNVTSWFLRAGSSQSTSAIGYIQDSSGNLMAVIDATGGYGTYLSGNQKLWLGQNILLVATGASIGFKDNIASTAGSVDVQLSRLSAGYLRVVDAGGSTLAGLAVGALEVGTNQTVISSSSNKTTFILRAGSSQAGDSLAFIRDSSNNLMSIIDAGGGFASYLSNVQKIWHGQKILTLSNDASIGWKDNADSSLGTVDIKIMREGVNELKVVRNDETTYAGIKVGSIAVAGTGAGIVDLALSTVPANPAAGYLGIWADTSDSRVKTLNSAGAQTVLVDRDSAETLTQKTLVPAILRVPNSTTLPGTCTVGDSYMDTDATSGQRFYLCQSTNTWALQGDGNSGGGGTMLSEYSGTLDFGNILDFSCSTLTFSATGAVTGIPALIAVPAALSTGLTARGWFSAADTGSVQLCNFSGADIDPASGSFTLKAARGYSSASSAIDFANICAGCSLTSTISLTGALTSHAAVISPPTGLSTGIQSSARVTASDTITVTVTNTTDADIDPASGTFVATIIQ